MGAAIPGQHNLGFTGAKEIGGSVLLAKNNPNKCHLYRDMGGVADGNRRTWTFSAWVKRNTLSAGTRQCIWGHGSSSNGEGFLAFGDDDKLYFGNDGHANFVATSNALYRDTSAWYHIIWAADSTQGSNDNRWKIYINGVLLTADKYGSPSISQNGDGYIQYYSSEAMDIAIGERERGKQSGADDEYPFDGQMCEIYFIDGAQKAHTDFGFVDPLTGNWRPKKYTGTYGTYGYYLPCDGSGPVGKDQSGNGLDFRTINFPGTTTIDKATGALPILNTVSGGNVASVGVRTDADSPGQLVLAVPFAGIATDVSPQLNGGTTATPMTVTSATFNWGNTPNLYDSSIYFDGTDDSMWIESDAQMDFGTGDFTIEIWMYPTDISHERHLPIIQNGNSASNNYYDWRLYFNNHGVGASVVWFEAECGGTDISVESKSHVNTHVWQHIAITRESGTFKIFFNGQLQDTDSSTGNAIDTDRGANLELGFNDIGASGDTFYKGYLQDLRIYKGVAKYKHDFIPASSFPHILADSPTGAIVPTDFAKSNYGSVYFDGVTSYLIADDHNDLDFGSDDFCVEMWIYPRYAYNTFGCVYSKGVDFQLYWHNTNKTLSLYVSSDGSNYDIFSEANLTGTNSLPVDQWAHIAITRSGSTWRAFINGGQRWTGTSSATIYANAVGAHVATYGPGVSSYEYGGFISNCRVVKGSAVYTSNFTPSDSPLGVITNTKLLCCQSGITTSQYAAIPTGSLDVVNNSKATTFNPFDRDIRIVQGDTGNYATLNVNDSASSLTIARGALRCYSSGADKHIRATFKMPEYGKWYWEMKADTVAAAGYLATGLYYRNGSLTSPAIATAEGRWITASGNKGGAGGSSSAYGKRSDGTAGYDDGDYVSIAVDMDNGTIFAAINGVWCENSDPVRNYLPMYDDLRTAYDDMDWYPVCCNWQAGNVGFFNFGQRPFRYPPPKGFHPLSTTALGAVKGADNRQPGVPRPEDYFEAIMYTGDDSAPDLEVRTTTGFTPDLVYMKSQTQGYGWYWFDSVRRGADAGGDPAPGLECYYHLQSNSNAAQGTSTGNGIGIVKGGFNVDYQGQAIGEAAQGTNNMIAYCHRAGGHKGTFNIDDVPYATAAAAGLSGGTTDPTACSISTKAGFAILQYEGNDTANSTIAHGLGRTPAFIIIKNIDATQAGVVYHAEAGQTGTTVDGAPEYYMFQWDSSGDRQNWSDNTIWHCTDTTFKFDQTGGANYVNNNGDTYIAYVWANVPGFQHFGSYNGVGAPGLFVNTGFRPSTVITKGRTGGNQSWTHWDDTRDENQENPCLDYFHWNETMQNGSHSSAKFDIYSNGFRGIEDGNAYNASGWTYIYAAWAKSPLNTLYGGQANAR